MPGSRVDICEVDYLSIGETGYQLNQSGHSRPLGRDVARIDDSEAEIDGPDCPMMWNISGDENVGDIGSRGDEI